MGAGHRDEGGRRCHGAGAGAPALLDGGGGRLAKEAVDGDISTGDGGEEA